MVMQLHPYDHTGAMASSRGCASQNQSLAARGRCVANDLERLRVPLKILTVDQWSDIPDALLAFCLQHKINRVHCNREHGVNERKRDRNCYASLKANGIAMRGQ